MKTRKEKIAVNIASAASLTVLKMLMSFVTRIIFLKILNESYLGINALFTNVLGVLSLADLGVYTAMMYSLYKPLAENDTEKIASLIAYFKRIYTAIASVVFLVGVALIPFLPYIINLEEEIPYINIYYFISLMSTVISYLFVYRSLLISADQKEYVVNNISWMFRIIMFVANVVVLIATQNYILYLLSTFFVSLTNNLFINLRAMKMYPYLRQKAKPLPAEDKRKIKEDVKDLFLYKFSATLVNNADNILTSILVSTVMVGLYSNYLMIVTYVSTFVNIVFNQLKATLGNKFATDRDDLAEQLKLFYVIEYINFWIVGFCSIAFFVLFNDFIELAFGVQFVLSYGVVGAVVLNFYTTYIRQTVGTFRQTLGVFKQMRYITLVTAAINLGLSLVLGYFMGLFGILMATAFATMLYAFWKEPLVLFAQCFKTSSKQYFVNYFINALRCLVAGGITYYAVARVGVSNAYLAFGCKVIISAILPNAIFLLMTFRTKEFGYIKQALLLPVLQKVKKRVGQ